MPTKKSLIIYLGTDHAAFILKEKLKKMLVDSGYNVVDMGAFDGSPSDYPDFVIPAAEAVAKRSGRAVAIVLGGSGIGECIAANKVRGVRAALAFDTYTARMSREHNDANVLCIGSRTSAGKWPKVSRIVSTWLKTAFSGDKRHKRRLKKIGAYERGRVAEASSHPSLGGTCVHQ